MLWRISHYMEKRQPPEWIEVGTVEARTEGEAIDFAFREYGMEGTDAVTATALIKREHAAYLYNAVTEFLDEIDPGQEPYTYPDTTAVAFMRHAVELVERSEDPANMGPPRRVMF
jgi:hypothetical protein